MHVINIEVDSIARYLQRPKSSCQFAHPAFRTVAPAALMKTQRPQWRQRSRSRQSVICLRHLIERRTVHEKKVHFAPFSPHTADTIPPAVKIEMRTPGIVQEDTISPFCP